MSQSLLGSPRREIRVAMARWGGVTHQEGEDRCRFVLQRRRHERWRRRSHPIFLQRQNPEAVKATLTGRSTYQGDYEGDAYVGECKWAFKRVSTTDPEVESCVAED